MTAYLVFSMESAKLILKKKNSNKIFLYITDKLPIYSFLKFHKFKTILLDNLISTEFKNKVFKKNYFKINAMLKKIGKRQTIKIENSKYNTLYINYRGIAPRLYIGILLTVHALEIAIKEEKIKTLIYLNDNENIYLNNNFYLQLFKLFSINRKITFISHNLSGDQFKKIETFFQKAYFLIYSASQINLKKIKQILKKIFTNLIFKNKEFFFIEETLDLNYSNYNPFKTFFLKLTKKHYSLEFYDLILKENNLDYPANIFFKYISCNNLLLDIYSIKLIKWFKKKFFKPKLKLFWSSDPIIETRTFLTYFKKKAQVFGLQHGGKQLIMANTELINKDNQYPFCDNFYSYGASKYFTKKNLGIKNLVNVGCLKSNYQEDFLKNIKTNNNNLLYVPISLSSFFIPTLEITANEKYKDQLKLCKFLNSQKLFNAYIKNIINIKFKDFIINYKKLNNNPITYELKKFKCLNEYSGNIFKAIKKIKPKLIIFDSISTPLYEVLTSKCEIIILTDRYINLKSDAKVLLEKRVHIVNNVKKISSKLKEIYINNTVKVNNNEFYEKFYKLKKNIF